MRSGWTKAKRHMTVAERLDFYSIPEPNSGCLLWLGSVRNGYGSLQIGHAPRKGAHRVSWEVHRGPIPAGMYVCHRCDVPICINPDHLFLGTAQDNVDDMNRKGRITYGRGSKSNASILTEEQVLAIRADPRSSTIVGREYGTDASNVQLIRKRKTWTHI